MVIELIIADRLRKTEGADEGADEGIEYLVKYKE